jgi:uracil-DNA glycosylase family 4
VVRVERTVEMTAILAELQAADVLVMAAAPADFQAEAPASRKIKRAAGVPELRLAPAPDILKSVREQRRETTAVVAFAAETEELAENARRKLLDKGADLLVANDVSKPGIGFDADDNEVILYAPRATRDGIDEERLPRASKAVSAGRILDRVASILAGKWPASALRGSTRSPPTATSASASSGSRSRRRHATADGGGGATGRGGGGRAPAPAAQRRSSRSASSRPWSRLPLVRSLRNAHQTVFADGSSSARIACFGGARPTRTRRAPFVGKRPAPHEDDRGEWESRKDVYIANVLKCRPPGNQQAARSSSAAATSSDNRARVPDAIVALGNFAARFLLGTEEGIMRLRGRWGSYQGIPVMPTFHPSFLLRSPEKKKEAWSDLLDVMKKVGLPLPTAAPRAPRETAEPE